MNALIVRDFKLALRSGGGFGLALVFFVIIVFFLPLGISPDKEVFTKMTPGLIWVSSLLSCLLSLDRIFALDYEDGTLEQMIISPQALEAIVSYKAISHWLTNGLPITFIGPLLAMIIGFSEFGSGWLFLSLLIGTPALSVIGTFGAALTLGIKRGGLLLSVIVLPLYIPNLIFGAELARRGEFGLETDVPLFFLAGLSLGTIAVLPFISAAVLRIHLKE